MIRAPSATSSLPPTWARISSADSPLSLLFDSVFSYAPRQSSHACPLSLPMSAQGRGGRVHPPSSPSKGSALEHGQPKLVISSALLLSQELMERKLLMFSRAIREVMVAGRAHRVSTATYDNALKWAPSQQQTKPTIKEP